MKEKNSKRLGLFICHCGTNIAGTVDIPKVTEELKKYPGLVYVKDYKYMCSEPGQNILKEGIKKNKLQGVVVASCSPNLHETTFRNAAESAGLNPYQCEIANIREQCSWVHKDKEQATEKAIRIIKTLIEKVKLNESLSPVSVPVTKKVLVIGGGIAGIQTSLEIASSGYEVILIEKSSSLGGHLSQISQTFPDLGHPADFLISMVDKLERHPKIKVFVNSELDEFSGYVGNFSARIKTKENYLEEKIGAVVVATGFNLDPVKEINKYGGGKYKDVIDSLEFERLLSENEFRRPSDGKIPEEIVFIQCVGFRDSEEKGIFPYCSKICCMFTVKEAVLYKKKVPQGQVYIFYQDIRSGGKGCEEFVKTAQEEERILYLRGYVSGISGEDGKINVLGKEELSGKEIEINADLVVLVPAMVASNTAKELAKKLRISTNEYGFFNEAHPKLRPLETLTAGIFLAGCCQAPKDIPETVSQASGCASKVQAMFSGDELFHEPTIVMTNEKRCRGCGICIPLCPYGAREFDEARKKVIVNEVLCEGCGTCAASCPAGAAEHRNYTDKQIFRMLESMV